MGQKLVQYRLGMLSSLLFSFFVLCFGNQGGWEAVNASGLMAMIPAMTGHLGFQ